MKFVWKDDVYNGDGYYDVPGVRFEIQKNGEIIEENSYPMFGGKLDIYLNRIAQKYLAGGTLDFTSGVTQHPDMCGVFTLVRRSGHQAIVKEENYVYAFDGEPTSYLSTPINGKLDPRMKFFWTAFLEEGGNIDIE